MAYDFHVVLFYKITVYLVYGRFSVDTTHEKVLHICHFYGNQKEVISSYSYS